MNDDGEVRLDSLKIGQEFALYLPGLEHLPSPCRWRFGTLEHIGLGSCMVNVTQAQRWDGLDPKADLGHQWWAPETPVFVLDDEPDDLRADLDQLSEPGQRVEWRKKKETTQMYAEVNFKTKKEFKEAVAAGKQIRLFAPGLGAPKRDGTEFVEGPHYPKPHTWYAQVTMKDGIVVAVK